MSEGTRIKNAILIIKGLKKLLEKDYSISLILVGRYHIEYLGKIIKKLGIGKYVHFIRYVENKYLPYIYSASHIMIFPSLYEGFGLPVIEAAMCKTPVITSNITIFKEIMGNSGIYINPFDHNELALKIEELLEDKSRYNYYKQKQHETVKKYTWINTAKKLLSVYKEAL